MPDKRYQTAAWLPLPENQSQPEIVPRIGIVHSQGGTGSLYNFFGRSSNLESTFWIGVDGRVEQYGDLDRRMDANRWANTFAFSIETENHAAYAARGDWDGDPWSEQQIVAITRLLAWSAKEWGIKRQLCDAWDGHGFGWHIQFGTPGPWTPIAKACPGRRRIEQFNRIIIPALAGDYNEGEPFGMDDLEALGLKIIAGVERIQADDHAATLAAIEKARVETNKDITNAVNRAINTLGKGFDPEIVSTLPNKV